MTTAVRLVRHNHETTNWHPGETLDMGAGERSPAVASGKLQSNAARTQCPPIPPGIDQQTPGER